MKYFRYLATQTEIPWYERAIVTTVRRFAFTAIGVIMVLWAWSLLWIQILNFPNVDWVATFVGLFSMILGIRNALSFAKGVSWGQAFLTLVFVAVMAYFVWFA